jgi:hypothetical protein
MCIVALGALPFRQAVSEPDPNANIQTIRVLDDGGAAVQHAAIFYRYLGMPNPLPEEKRKVYTDAQGYAQIPYDSKGIGLAIYSETCYHKVLTMMSPERKSKLKVGMNDQALQNFWGDTITLIRKQARVPMYVSDRPSVADLKDTAELIEFGFEFVPFTQSKGINPKISAPLMCDIVFEVKRVGIRREPVKLFHPDGIHTYQVRIYGRNGWQILPMALSEEDARALHEAPAGGYAEEVTYQSLGDLPSTIYLSRGGEFDKRYGVLGSVGLKEYYAPRLDKRGIKFFGYYKVQAEQTGNRSLDPDPKKEELPVGYDGDYN